MFYFTCNESKIYESLTFWNKLQEKNYFFTIFKLFETCISPHTSELIRLHLSSVTSSLNTSNPVPLEAHASHCSTMFHRWCCVLWIMSCSKPSTYFFVPVILVHVDLNFSCPKNAFPEVVWLFNPLGSEVILGPLRCVLISATYKVNMSFFCIQHKLRYNHM